MVKFYIHTTDLFGGELNYCGICRYIVNANTERGAISKVARFTGLNFRRHFEEIYHSTSRLTGLVVEASCYDADGDPGRVEEVAHDYDGRAIEL